MTDLESVSALARGVGRDFDRAGLHEESRILQALVSLVTSGVPSAVVHIHGDAVPAAEASSYLRSLCTHPTAWPSLEPAHLEPAEWRRRLETLATALADRAEAGRLDADRP